MHAGALTFREDLTADQMRCSLAVIQAKAHEALTDLREVLGVLRDEADATPLTGPQPTYGDLATLVADARAAGTIRKVAGGDPMLSPSVTRALIARVRTDSADDQSAGHRSADDQSAGHRSADARRRLERLTERELEVATAVGRGLSNAEIAAALHLSVPTVKGHVSRLFEKLETTNRVQIALCVRDAGHRVD